MTELERPAPGNWRNRWNDDDMNNVVLLYYRPWRYLWVVNHQHVRVLVRPVVSVFGSPGMVGPFVGSTQWCPPPRRNQPHPCHPTTTQPFREMEEKPPTYHGRRWGRGDDRAGWQSQWWCACAIRTAKWLGRDSALSTITFRLYFWRRSVKLLY